MKLIKEFRFEAAHALRGMPADHKCHRLHGHSYRLVVELEGEIQGMHMVIDFEFLSLAVQQVVTGVLDHRNLNEVLETEMPTAEYLAEWVVRQLCLTMLEKPPERRIAAVEVWETPTTGVRLER